MTRPNSRMNLVEGMIVERCEERKQGTSFVQLNHNIRNKILFPYFRNSLTLGPKFRVKLRLQIR